MTSITGRRSLLATMMGTPRRELRLGVAVGLAVLIPILVADMVLGTNVTVPGSYVLGAFAAALVGGLTPAAILVALAAILGVISPEWNHNFGSIEYWIRLSVLGVGGALAIITAWMREGSRAYTGRLSLLDQIGAIADGSLSLADTLQRAVELITPAAADLAIIDAIHHGEVTRVAVRVRAHPDWPAIERTLRARTPSTPFWLRDPEFGIPPVPQFLPRVTDAQVEMLGHGGEDTRFMRSLGMQSVIIVPLIARKRLLGTLTVAVAWSKRRYGRDDLTFIKTLSGRLALALDNAGLFSDLESVERRMDAVMDRIPEAVTVHEASGSLVFANQAAADLIGMTDADEVLAAGPAARVGRYELYAEDGRRLPDEDLVVEALRAGDLPLRGTFRLLVRETREERWISVAVEPISGPEENLLYAVTTIEDVTAGKRAELAQTVLARAGELLRSARDHEETLRRVAELATNDFANTCAVSVQGDDGVIELAAIAHRETDRGGALHELEAVDPDGQSPVARVLRGEKPQIVAAGGPPSIVVPMTAGAKVVGALTLVSASGSRRFDEADLEVAVEFGRRAGLAVENARVAEMRIEINRTLQRGLLPADLPTMPGWRVATMYRPAGELNEVGGDFYEVVEIDGGWMVVLGDVVGRGAEAAALTALARHTLHTAGALTSDPVRALAMLNRRLRERDPTPLCSAAVIVLQKAEQGAAEAAAVAAGHPLPLLVRGAEVTEAAVPGPLLGALNEPAWTTTMVELAPGDQLVVYTDGVTDARSGGEMFGEERLRAEVSDSGRPEAAVARVESALQSFAGEIVADDAALVAIMRSPGRPARAADLAPGRQVAAATGHPPDPAPAQ
jgi:PAS domain S-box-containing protein